MNKNVLFIFLLLIQVSYKCCLKQFMKSNPSKILIVTLSKSKSSAFSLLATHDDDKETSNPKEKVEFETLSKKLVSKS